MRFFRKIGLFDATIYLECNKLDGRSNAEAKTGTGDEQGQDVTLPTHSSYEHLNFTSTVHVVGEFSPENPW